MKKRSLTSLLVMSALLMWNSAWADFYLIVGGKRAKRTIVVSPKATPTESGSALLAARDSIIDASPDKRYLIHLEPGIYDIGGGSLWLRPYVDIQGSGEKVTRIRGHRSNQIGSTFGVVQGHSDAELRFLTVENTASVGHPIAIYTTSKSNLSLLHVTAICSGSGGEKKAIWNEGLSDSSLVHVTAISSGGGTNYAIFNSASPSSLRMRDVRAEASEGTNSYAIHNDSSSPTMNDVTAIAQDGENNLAVSNTNSSSPTMTDLVAIADPGPLWNYAQGVGNSGSSFPIIRRATIEGQDAGMFTPIGNGVTVSQSTIINGGAGGGGHIRCVACDNGNGKALSDLCVDPDM